jgi:hypothetical protein
MVHKFASRLLFGFTALTLLGACASSSTVAAVTPTPLPTPTPSAIPSPSPTLLPGEVRGFGDTATNPDSTYICAASASVNGQIVAYLTIAGTDTAAGQSACTALEQGGAWVAVSTLPAGSYLALDATNGCFDTIGPITSRIYTATAGLPADTLRLCTGFGL